MLIFNGRKFAASNAEFCDQLFDDELHFEGTYKRAKNGIKLYDQKGKLRAFIVNRSERERFIVTAHMVKGKPRYMHDIDSVTGAWLGLNELATFAAERNAIKNAIETIAS